MPVAISSRVQSVRPDRAQGQRLTVQPILGPSHQRPEYELLRDKTIADVVVTEISDSGSVPQLRVENRLDVRVFLMDGQELRGAKQNRILNTDVIVPAKTTITIPVSCVEQGRWRHVSSQFAGGKSASYRTRSAKVARVHESLKQRRGHDANQMAVWDEVRASLSVSGAQSDTAALSDAYAARQRELDDFRSKLQLPEEAVGLAMFQNGQFLGLDLFDRHSTLSYFWQSLVDSYALDLLAEPIDPAQPATTESGQTIERLFTQLVEGKWESFASPGEGAEWRLEDPAYAASSLLWNDEVVMHLQVFPKQEGTREVYRPRIRRNYRVE